MKLVDYLVIIAGVVLALPLEFAQRDTSENTLTPSQRAITDECGALNMVSKCIMEDGTVCYLANNGVGLALDCNFKEE